MDALKQGLVGDASVDADIKQAIKTGTFAARPAASLAGRQYWTTDTLQQFIDSGAVWNHAGGQGIFDSFDRTSGDALGTSDSGHAWTEHAGDIDIVVGAEATATTANSLATVDSGAPLRTAHYGLEFRVGNTASNLDVGLVLRYVDASNYLFAQALGSANQLRLCSVIGGGAVTALNTMAVTWTAVSRYVLDVFVRGPVVKVALGSGVALPVIEFQLSGLTQTYNIGGLSGATRTGLRFGTGGAGSDAVLDFYCIPNA